MLGGYNRYRVADGGMGRLRLLPPVVRHGLAAILTAVGPGAWDRVGGLLPGFPPALGTKVHKLARVLGADTPGAAYAALTRQWDPSSLLLDPRSSSEALPELRGASPLQSMLLADQTITLPDNMLVKVDRASMAVGLEVRVPFLDHRFVELTWRLPDSAKVRTEALASHDRGRQNLDYPLWTLLMLQSWLEGSAP